MYGPFAASVKKIKNLLTLRVRLFKLFFWNWPIRFHFKKA